jgi:pyruvate kinase
MLRTKIICTIGPASRDPAMLRALMQAGMDVARLNFSHGSLDEHAENIARIRAAAGELGKAVAILADLQGPKLRVGKMVEGGVTLQEGQEITLVASEEVGRPFGPLPVQYGGFARLVQPGNRVLLDDGLLELQVTAVTGGEVRCRVVVGGVLESNKGMNLPHASLNIPSITDKDRRDLAFALEQGVDWVALSFVRQPDEVRQLKQLIGELAPSRAQTPVMAKIEKPEALDHIAAIIEAADAIMVARGDLGIEIRTEEVPIAQKEIIEVCNRAGVPVVTATQMLDSMIRNPRPTRAEASDVANAILDGTDAIMLSGETSVGAYALGAVQTMARIAAEVEAHRDEVFAAPFLERAREPQNVALAVARAARGTAEDLGAAAIITPTLSGYTARLMSSCRPHAPIVAVTPQETVQRQIVLCWGVTPLLAPRTDSSDETIEHAVQAARGRGLVQEGDTVVVTAGAAGSAPGTTNLMRVLVVDGG